MPKLCFRSFSCHHKGQLTDITSSNKKRKLSKPDINEPQISIPRERSSEAQRLPATLPTVQPSSPENQPPFKIDETALPLSSPLRSIPQHLLKPEGSSRRSPTPDISSTAASSPSAAYAGLTLDGDARGESFGSDTTAVPDTAKLSASRSILCGVEETTRSASPAKRTRSEMDSEHVEDVEADRSSSQAPESVSDLADTEPANKQSRISDIRHRRGISVDMIGDENSAQRDNTMEGGSETTSNGSYLTPQSGLSSVSSTATTSKASGQIPEGKSWDIPSIDDQIAQVMKLAQYPMTDGQKGYIVSQKWLTRVQARGTDAQKSGGQVKEAMEGEVGPVDDSEIYMITDPSSDGFKDEAGEPFVPLKPGLQLGEDYEVIPQDAWDLIIRWYGMAKGSPTITRYCHNTTTNESTENVQVELHPPVFTILKLPDTRAGITSKSLKEKDARPIKILASRHERYQTFLKRAKAAAGIDAKSRVRIWRVLGGLDRQSLPGMLTPAQSRSASPALNIAQPVDPGQTLVLDVNTFVGLQLGSQRELVEAKDETMNDKYNGHSNLNLVGLSRDDVIVLEEQSGGPAGGEWVSDAARTTAQKNGVLVSITKDGYTAVSNSLKSKANAGSGRTSPMPQGGMMTRGRTQKNGRTRGTIGLGNLGNTCYMNSALQCVRSVEELTQYFLQDYWKKELNPRNPLAHNGEVAKAYANLLRELYGEHSNSSFSPRNFKQIIGKYGPSFSGYGQQDSQEFLLFLLDGLQEDLNRIYKKPYIEKPDSTDEMVNDPVALKAMADKCWDIYKARNDSVVTDLFAGMYKSTVVCPVCDKVSIIFDPFNNLTLQLPIENVWSRSIQFFPLSSRPIEVSIDIDKNATFFNLKEFVGQRVGVDPKKMVIAEIYKNRFFKMFSDNTSLSDERIAEGDNIGVFELEDIPSNYPPPKKKGPRVRSMISYNNSDDEEDLPEGDSPLADKMLVGVFHRIPKESTARYHSSGKCLFGSPSYIIITREEAKDYDLILKKVLARVATMTTMPMFDEPGKSDTETAQQEDSDTVLMTSDDVDSSSDSKVQANSVQSEDGFVDVSMNDIGEEASTTVRTAYPPQGLKPRQLPQMLRPGEFIEPKYRAMFDMKYFLGTEMIPTAWSALQDENKFFPSISSRIPQAKQPPKRSPREQLKRHIKNGGSTTSSDEDLDDPPLAINNIAADHDDDAESDNSDGLPPVAQLTNTLGHGFGRSQRKAYRKKGGLITYSRKGKPAGPAHVQESETELERDDGPLLRLGEGIILDWNQASHDALFASKEESGDDGFRGAKTFDTAMTIFPDPILEEKRRIRANRKKNGVNLGDCLDEFGKAEILSQNDAWYCPRCKEHRRASKKFELWKSPDILVIHLKRFSAQGRLRDKLDVFVDFPVEGLDLSTRVAVQEDGKSPMYDLFAVDNHYGGLGGGHYTAFAKNFFDGSWYEYNDAMASRRQNPQQVVTTAAYLLFYRRRSSIPLGGPFFEPIFKAANDPPSDEPSESQPASRTESPSAPAGEGKRLDNFSRNGLSSASLEAEVAHQAGSGGLEVRETQMREAIEDDESLPEYSLEIRDEDLMLDTPEYHDLGARNGHHISEATSQSWNFAGIGPTSGRVAKAPPTSLGDLDENLFEDAVDDASTKAVSSTGATDDDETKSIMSDFGTREWTNHSATGFGISDGEDLLDGESPTAMEGAGLSPWREHPDREDHVVNVILEEEEGSKVD